jgi:hypothetical protein
MRIVGRYVFYVVCAEATWEVDCAFNWESVSSDRELQLKGNSQRGQESLDTEAEDATLLGAATKQRSRTVT